MLRTTSSERIRAAIELRESDRVPVSPDLDMYIAKHAGITMHELLFDLDRAEAAHEKAYRDFLWDANHVFLGGAGPYLRLLFMQEFKVPGVDGFGADEELQMVERELCGPEVYREICERGFGHVLLRLLRGSLPQLKRGRDAALYLAGLARFTRLRRRGLMRWERRGVPCLAGVVPNLIAFDMLSGLRSMAEFLKDLHRRPDEVLRALAIANRSCIELAVRGARATGARFCFIGSGRPSASFISPAQFERFALPLFVEAARRLVEEGVTPFLHFDSDWTPMLPYLRELPRRKCILDLDGSTDIFRAKAVLGDHMCLMGDVPAPLLKLGTPDEVEAYCRRLIMEVGSGGGFILSSGCSTPPDAKPENVMAMVGSVRKFRP